MAAIARVILRRRQHEAQPGFGEQPLTVHDAAIAQKFAEPRIVPRGRVHYRSTDHRAFRFYPWHQTGHHERLDQPAVSEPQHRVAPTLRIWPRPARVASDVRHAGAL